MTSVMDVLQWLIPAGALSSMLTWLVSRSTYRARNTKEREDIYKQLYENVSDTLLDIQKQYEQLQDKNDEYTRKQNRMEGMLQVLVAKAQYCRSWPQCPLRSELQKYHDYGDRRCDTSPKGKRDGTGRGERQLRTNPEGDDDADSGCGTAEEPDCTASGFCAHS